MMDLENESSIDFTLTNFDEYDKNQKEKENKKTLRDNSTDAIEKIISLERQIDKSEKYLRQSCILLHEIQETKGK